MENKEEYNENMNYVVDEINETDNQSKLDLDSFLTDFEKMDVPSNLDMSDDYYLAKMSEYDLNYNLKQLTMIYEYYELGNIHRKASKLKKADMIQLIVMFEDEPENCEIVMRRQLLWHYLEELKADKFMKRFVWST